MRKIISVNILLAFLFIGALPLAAARPSAKSVVENALKKLRSAKSLNVSFAVKNGGNSGAGKLTVAGKCFMMGAPDLKVWYDGATQWAYAPRGGEVNVTTPTAAELAESNPMSVLTNMSTAYACRRLSSSSSVDKIELTPRGKTDIAKAVVTFSVATGYPTDIVVTGTDRSVTSIHITSLKAGGALPASYFRFDSRKYPGVEIVDLR